MNVAELVTRRTRGTLSTLGLGSCVVIILYDPVARVGGMAHVMLPDESIARDRSKPGKFPRSAVATLLQEMDALGAVRPRIHARLAGGASMFASLLASDAMNIGQRNIEGARRALADQAIPIDAEDVGGDFGRSVHFTVDDGRVDVRSLKRDPRVL